MKKIILVLSMLIGIVFVTKAQVIKGRILDRETKTGLGGVAIRVGQQQTMTDLSGNFYLTNVKGKYELIASYIGYATHKQSISIPLNDTITIFLQVSSRELDEVTVSTGYQNLPKERATGSFSLIGEKRLGEQVGSNIINRLEGVTPSLTVDRRSNGGSMMIRGLSTLRSDRTPLIVLDNFPYDGNLDNLNPAEVESITILKDASAASIWGARAGNGVIVITTKKAKYNAKTQFQAGMGLNILAIPEASYNRNITATDLIGVEQMLFEKGYYTSKESAIPQIALSPVVEMLIAARDGKITPQALNDGLDILRNQNVYENYSNAFYEQGLNRQYYVNAAGGSSGMNWKVFGGMDDNESVLAAKYRRYNLKFEQNWKPFNGLELGLSLAYTQARNNNGRAELNSFYTASGALPSYTQFLDSDGNELQVMKDLTRRYTSVAANGKLLNWNYYPLREAELINTVTKTSDVIGNFRASYLITKGLKALVNYQYEQQLVSGRTDYDQDSYYTRNLINIFTQINGATVTRPIPLGSIVDLNHQELEVNNLRGQINYDRNFQEFNVNFLVGAERRESKTESNNGRVYGFDNETLSSASVDYANPYKNFVTGSNAYINDPKGFSGINTRFVSLFANGAVSYRGRYTISGSARRDGSNLFGVNTNNKWNPLWSAGFSWLLSEEAFAKGMPYTRLRATYGSSGNANSKFAAVTTIIYSGSSPYTQTPLASFSNYANPDLRWETVKTLNLGLDFRVLNDRLTGSVEYYSKQAKDLIGNAPIDYTAGIGFVVTKNAASISGRGIDLEFNSKNLNGALQWTTDFFLNIYHDKVKDYYLTSTTASNFISGDANVNGIVGMPVYAVYGFKWAGLNPLNGNPRGYLNNVISEDYNALTGSSVNLDDLEYIGPAFPTHTGALGNHFSWKSFNLDFRIGYKFGYYFRRPSLNYSTLFANRIGDSEYSERWMQAGDELRTNVPSQVYPANGARDTFYNYSTATIIQGDHIRLQSIGLGYTFSKEYLKTLSFESFSLQLQANNLGLLWLANKQGIDPDFPTVKPFKTFTLTGKVNF